MNDTLVPDDDVATQTGSTAIEIKLRLNSTLATVCSAALLDRLADAIVSSVTRTSKNLLRLYCVAPETERTVRVQILGTSHLVTALRSNSDVASEVQRQVRCASCPLIQAASYLDSDFTPAPVAVLKCSDGPHPFEPVCASPPVEDASWLGLEPHAVSSFLILGGAGLLLCALLCMCMVGFRAWRRRVGRKENDGKSNWFLNVLKDQADEIQKAERPKKDISSTPLFPSSPASETPPPAPIESISEPTPTPEPLEDTFDGHLQYDEPVSVNIADIDMKFEYPAFADQPPDHQLQVLDPPAESPADPAATRIIV